MPSAFLVSLGDFGRKENASAQKDLKTDPKKQQEVKQENDEMKLLGAENEQCGPGLTRDENGVCKMDS